MSFPENLYKLRKEKGLSQKKLAEMAGLSQAAIYYWEKGERKPKSEQLLKLAEALETLPGDLSEDSKYLSQSELDTFMTSIKNLSKSEKEIALTDFMDDVVDREINMTIDETRNNQSNKLINTNSKTSGKHENLLLVHYHKLNITGKRKAIEAVENLTYNPKYVNKED